MISSLGPTPTADAAILAAGISWKRESSRKRRAIDLALLYSLLYKYTLANRAYAASEDA